MSHTPAPWHVDAHSNVIADGGGLVAFPGVAAGFDQKANARLIAAAPDLLAALHNMLEDGDATDRQQALAAIAKAEGFTS